MKKGGCTYKWLQNHVTFIEWKISIKDFVFIVGIVIGAIHDYRTGKERDSYKQKCITHQIP